ncbi:MAG: hypothetical protein PHD58_07945 [Anaerolineales bacterium]|nr:hypothetical protein [Anaerolineales bacterium]
MDQGYGAPLPPLEEPKKKSSTVWIIVIVALVLLCCLCVLGVVGYYAWTSGDQWIEQLGWLPAHLPI